MLEARAWNVAKGLAEAPRSWKKPGFTIWRHEMLVDGEYRIYGYYYPVEHLHQRSGKIVQCEYIEVMIHPLEGDEVIFNTLVHEYLHAIFYRYEGDTDDFGEAWVQSLWKN